jgi:hypothetical protein
VSADGEFLAAFAATVKAAGIPNCSHTPESLLSLYARLVAECVDSFQGTIEEYYSLLGVRSVIHHVLCNGEMNRFAEIAGFAASVSRLDVAFQSCLDLDQRANIERTTLTNCDAWYWQYFPAYAGEELVRDLAVEYGYRSTVKRREAEGQ